MSRVGLVYFEPQGAEGEGVVVPDGFRMPFKAKALEPFLNSEKLVPPLLAEVRRLYDLNEPPEGIEACKDCRLLGGLLTRCHWVSDRRV